MTTPQIVLSVIYFLVALALVAIVMLQSGKSAGLSGAIAGGADTFLSKNKCFLVLTRPAYPSFPRQSSTPAPRWRSPWDRSGCRPSR